jgi:hypothetical protein
VPFDQWHLPVHSARLATGDVEGLCFYVKRAPSLSVESVDEWVIDQRLLPRIGFAPIVDGHFPSCRA